MERYLTSSQISKISSGKKYKKISYGGRKFFVKKALSARGKNKISVEFCNKNQRWCLEKEEQKRVLNLGVKTESILNVIVELNRNVLKKPISSGITKEEYFSLYEGYDDSDKLGYYKKNSPEYIRVTNILSVVKSGSRVYDAGCNSGGIGKILIKEKGCKVYGSELSPKMAKKATEKGLRVFCGWAEETLFESSYFDYVILGFILEHAISPEKIMEESVRLLKPEGLIIGHVPTEFGDPTR